MARPGSGGARGWLRRLGRAALVACVCGCLPLACDDAGEAPRLDGVWAFTFVPQGEGSNEQMTWRLSVEGSRVVLTPVEDGVSRIDQRLAGSLSGDGAGFDLRIDEPAAPPAGCLGGPRERRLRGQRVGDRLSGSYELRIQLAGDNCTEPLDSTSRGNFGALLQGS